MQYFSSLRPTASENIESIHPPPHEPHKAPGWAAQQRRRRARRVVLSAAALATVSAAVVGVGATRHARRASVPVAHLVSGAPAPRTTPAGARERWAADVPITIVLDGSLADLGPHAKDAARAAIGSWIASGADVPSVTIDDTTERGTLAQDGRSRVLVAPITIAGHEKDVAATITYADEATGRIVEADIVLNAAYAFGQVDDDQSVEASAGSDKCGGRYDVQNIVTHEAGHFFGLGEEMSDETATMYVISLPCQTHKRKLTTVDTTAMDSLYARTSGTSAVSPASSGASAYGGEAQAGSSVGGCGGSTAP